MCAMQNKWFVALYDSFLDKKILIAKRQNTTEKVIFFHDQE